ncbi:MAG: TonB-dependent receptor [Proteobacteria bacterium]|nr:TonB-dependent receptor [Pseudomonadota bacterium]
MQNNSLLIKKTAKDTKSTLLLKFIGILLFISLTFLPGTVWIGACYAETISTDDLAELSIRELMEIEIEITTGSKKSQTLANTAAAAFVITQEDIRRSGVTSIPEALRMVPGLQVARIDANKWAISSRGFNSRLSNKLLVLMDGRTLYSPLYTSAFWDIQDTLLDDIDRIEVIRGPGAALWGANAVNGVINIITKNAKDTTGGLISVGAGKEERGFGSFRFGDTLGRNAYYRIFGKYADRDEFRYSSGRDASDDWDIYTLGFRTDWNPTATDSVMFQANNSSTDSGSATTVSSLTPPYSTTLVEDNNNEGINFLVRWQSILSNTSDMILQLYYDRTKQNLSIVGETRDTYDLDFQHRFSPLKDHETIWGLGYRLTKDNIKPSSNVSIDPNSRTDDLLSAFVQDDIKIFEDYLRLTIGAKFEYNDYTGFEFQPNIRALWTPDKQNSIWASFSRATRTPSRAESNGKANFSVLPPGIPPNSSGLPILIQNIPNDNLKSEILYAYEIGYRNQISDSISMDITAFYNKYNNLRSTNLDFTAVFFESDPLPSHLVAPILLDNDAHGHTYGIEVYGQWQPIAWWKIKPAYSFLHINITKSPSYFSIKPLDKAAPRHQLSLMSNMDLPMNLELDLWLRTVDDLPVINIDGYCMVDARLGWKPTQNLELSLAGQNIFDNQHKEFNDSVLNLVSTEVERTIYFKITWHF